MNDSTRTPRRPRSWRRRAAYALAVLAVLGVIGWAALEWVVQIDRYRPQVVAEIEKRTGLPISIGQLELTLFPTPAVTAHQVVLGEGLFLASARDVVVHARLAGLASGEIDVTDVSFKELSVRLPEEPAAIRARFKAVSKAASLRSSGKSEQKKRLLRLGRLRTSGAKLFLGDSDQAAALCTINVRDPLDTTIPVQIDARTPLLGQDARLRGTLTLTRQPGGPAPVAVEGEVRLTDLDSNTILANPKASGAVVNVTGTFKGPSAKDLEFSFNGDANPNGRSTQFKPLAGTFSGRARWREAALSVDPFTWDADGLKLVGTGSWSAQDGWEARVAEATLPHSGLTMLLALLPESDVRMTLGEGAALALSDLHVARKPGDPIEILSGKATGHGVDLAFEGQEPAFAGVRVACTVRTAEENPAAFSIDIEDASCDGAAVSGTVLVDPNAKTVQPDVFGKVELTPERLGILGSLRTIEDAAGLVRFHRVHGTFGPGRSLPSDLVIEGSVESAGFAIESSAWQDRFDGVSGSFFIGSDTVKAGASGRSARAGEFEADGAYGFSGRVWEGRVSVDAAEFDLPLTEGSFLAEAAPLLLAAYGPSFIDLKVELPSPGRQGVAVHAERKADPPFQADVSVVEVFTGDERHWELGDLEAMVMAPPEVGPLIPPNPWKTSGPVRVAVVRSAKTERFSVTTDLTPAAVGLEGWTLEKKAGDFAEVLVEGPAGPTGWHTEDLTVRCLTETVKAGLSNGTFALEPFDVDVAALARLLPGEASGSGRIRGSVSPGPANIALTLADAALTLGPDAKIDSATGRITYSGNRWQFDHLRLQAPNTDCVVDAHETAGAWQGSISGDQLDLNALTAFWDATKGLRESPASDAPDGPASAQANPLFATFTVRLGTLYHRRARIERVQADVVATGEVLRARDLSFSPYGGDVAGNVAWHLARPGAHGVIDMALELTDVDLRVIDELFLTEPQHLAGPVSGLVRLRLPWTGEEMTYAGANGRFVLEGRDGTLGTHSLATKILTVIRATEIIHLRLPKLRDEGLSYDKCTFEADLVNGLLTIRRLELERPSYRIDVTGAVDLPGNRCHLEVGFFPFEAVATIADIVPGVRQVVRKIDEQSAIRFVVKGPLDDPKTVLAPSTLINTVTDGLVGGAKKGEQTVVDGVLGIVDGVLKELDKDKSP